MYDGKIFFYTEEGIPCQVKKKSVEELKVCENDYSEYIPKNEKNLDSKHVS